MTYNPGFPNAPINYDHQNESAFRSMVRQALNDVGGTVVIEGAIGELYDGNLGDTLIHDGDVFVASTQFTVNMQFEQKIQFYDLTTAQTINELFQEGSTAAGGSGGGGSGTGLVSQTASGKLIRRGDTDFLSTPGDEWDATEWSGFGGATLSVEGTGKLQIGGSETDEWHGGIFTPLAARTKQMIQAIVFFGTGGTSNSYLGVSAMGTSDGATPSFDGYASVKQAGPTAGDDRFTLFRIAAGAIAETKVIENDHDQSPTSGWKQTAFHDHVSASEAARQFVAYCGPNDLLGDGQTELDLSTVSSGQVAFVKGKTGSAGLARMTKMFVSADRYITVQNLPTGFKAKLYDAGDALLVSATESGGTATLDVAGVWAEDIAYLRVDNGSDVEQARFTIVNEVMYGGTVYDYNQGTLPSGSVRQTATGAKKAFMDFNQYTVASGLPEGWRHIGSGGAPVFAIANDPVEGNYLKVTGHGTNERAVVYTPWDGMLDREGEMLARVWVNAAEANRRIGGPGFLIWGTDSTDLNGMAGGMYMRTTGDFESNVVEYEGGAGVVPVFGDLQEAEQTGVWMWIRWRRDDYQTAPIPDSADLKVKAWFGDLADEPAGWDNTIDNDPQGIEVAASGIGWFLADIAYSGEQRIAYLSWTSDPTDPPDEPSPIASDAEWMTIQNPVDDETRLQIKARTAAFTAPVAATLSLVREDSTPDRMTWLLRNDGVADEYQMHFLKTGAASYLPFYIRWDSTQALELLSPDDVGGPKWTFSVASVFSSTLQVVGATTLSSTLTVVGNADFQSLVQVTDGTAAAPGLHFSDVDTGLFASGATLLGLTVNGNEIFAVRPTGGSPPLARITGTTTGFIDEMLSLITPGLDSPFIVFYQNTSTAAGEIGFYQPRDAFEILALDNGSDMNFWTKTGAGGFVHTMQLNAAGAPHVYINPASGVGEEMLRMRGTSVGNVLTTFYQSTTERARIGFRDSLDTFAESGLSFESLEDGAYQMGLASTGRLLFYENAGISNLTASLNIIPSSDAGDSLSEVVFHMEELGDFSSYWTWRAFANLHSTIDVRNSLVLEVDAGSGLERWLWFDYTDTIIRLFRKVHLKGTAGVPLRVEGPTGQDRLLVLDSPDDTTGVPYLAFTFDGSASDFGTLGVSASDGSMFVSSQNGDIELWPGDGMGGTFLVFEASVTAPQTRVVGLTGINELLRLRHASATGSPFLSFWQLSSRAAYIQYLNPDIFRFASDVAGNKFQFRNNSESVSILTLQTVAPTAGIIGQTDEMLRLDRNLATGSPYLTFYQSGTRRSYIQHLDGGPDKLLLVSQYGAVALRPGTAGTPAERLLVSDAGPHVHIKGKTAVDELLRVDHADATGSPILSIRQAATERARLQWVDADTDFLIEAFEAASRINLKAPSGVHVTAALEIDGDLNHDGTNLGVFATAPTTQQTVTGSRSGNAALASLLTALANYGLIVDSSTA